MIRQRYTGCNPLGMMLSRDKVLAKRVLATHRVATPSFRLFPFGRSFREPRGLTFPLFVKSATEDASLGISQASLVEDMKSLRRAACAARASH
jgi:D-alanine-D-alanine ligase